MKEQYEICQKKDYSLQEQQDKLIQSYQEIVENVLKTPHYMLPKSIQTKSLNRGISKEVPTPKKRRRRSFDNNKTTVKTLKPSSSTELPTSQSLVELSPIEEQQGDQIFPPSLPLSLDLCS
jgi:hypothetical protein